VVPIATTWITRRHCPIEHALEVIAQLRVSRGAHASRSATGGLGTAGHESARLPEAPRPLVEETDEFESIPRHEETAVPEPPGHSSVELVDVMRIVGLARSSSRPELRQRRVIVAIAPGVISLPIRPRR
jgi:hypothetical protein